METDNNASEAISFMKTLHATGGGGAGGEAVLDGLSCATKNI